MVGLENQGGYAYVMVIAAAAVLAILAAIAAVLTSYEVRHEKEMELLFRGLAYEKAIGAYYRAGPAGQTHSYPHQLEDLLFDPRFPRKRYLRALYPEPFGSGWALVRSADGSITGLASQCHEKPLKQDGFPSELQSFAGSEHYSDWIFLYQPNTAGGGAVSQGAVANKGD